MADFGCDNCTYLKIEQPQVNNQASDPEIMKGWSLV